MKRVSRAVSHLKHPALHKVLVIGGAGTIGARLINVLVQAGYSVRALQHRTRIAVRSGLEIKKGAIHEFESLRAAVEGMDAVCCFVRVAHDAGRDSWMRVCVQGTHNLLEACKQAGTRRVVIGCGDNIFGVPRVAHSKSLNESSKRRWNGTDYSLFKILEDELIWQYHYESGVPITSMIFPLVWRDDLLPSGIRTLDHDNRTIQLTLDRGGEDFTRHDIHLEDAVQAILLVLASDQAIGERFLFAGPEPHSSSQLAEVLKGAYPYSNRVTKQDWESWSIDYAKASRMLGYEPAVNLLGWLTGKLNK